MKIKLQARNLWEAIEPRDIMLQEDRMVLDAITSTVPQEMLASLTVKVTAAEAWEAVRSLRIDSEVVRNARAQRLRTEFESIRFKEGEIVDDFTMRSRQPCRRARHSRGGDQGAACCPEANAGHPEAPLSGDRRD
jgi:predicted phage gp36 major capsid-like protein